MHKTVHGKNLLVNFFLIAAAILLILFASFTATKIFGSVVKLSMHTTSYKINTAKNILNAQPISRQGNW
jgi:hypothetical protein